MNNPWPKVDNVLLTNDVVPYLEETSESLRQNYEGKLQSKISEIKYVLQDVCNTISMLGDISVLTEPVRKKPDCKEVKDVEIGRKAAFVENHNYKYEIYNDHLYYKLFTISVPEFYPITLKASAGTLDKEEKVVSIDNLDELKDTFLEIVCSDKVRSIIKKMLL